MIREYNRSEMLVNEVELKGYRPSRAYIFSDIGSPEQVKLAKITTQRLFENNCLDVIWVNDRGRDEAFVRRRE